MSSVLYALGDVLPQGKNLKGGNRRGLMLPTGPLCIVQPPGKYSRLSCSQFVVSTRKEVSWTAACTTHPRATWIAAPTAPFVLNPQQLNYLELNKDRTTCLPSLTTLFSALPYHDMTWHDTHLQWLSAHTWKVIILIGLGLLATARRFGRTRSGFTAETAGAPDPGAIVEDKRDGIQKKKRRAQFWDMPHGARPPSSRPRGSSHKQRPKGCWIFTHMNKSGGTTIKGMLQKHARRIRGTYRVYSQVLFGEGEERLKTFLSQNATVIASGYSEAFRPFGGGERCKWFTMFRQ